MKKILRFAGLALITLVAGIFGFILVAGAFEEASEPLNLESLGIIVLSILSVLTAVICWFRVRIGAWMAVGVGSLFTVFALITAGQRHLLAVLVSGFPLILGGGLLLFSLRDKKAQS